MPNIRSMTAFARHEEQNENFSLTWEIKSVNHRYLDLSFRFPEKLKQLENECRNRLRKNLNRGKIEINLRLDEQANENASLLINEQLLKQLVEAKEKIESLLLTTNPSSAIDFMRWPGVVGTASTDMEKLGETALMSFNQALNQFIDSRSREGHELEQMIQVRLEKIEGFVEIFRKNLPETLRNHREKLQQRLMQILDKQKEQLDSDRLEQELVIFAQKIDIEEELDRLEAHTKEVTRILNEGGAVGRQLDFLMQELNREANTIGSKSANAEQSQAVVDLKVLIEQMREQIQNIE